ncbi:CGNR zinc finger domain-containing protein [Dactylosporangium sp. CS-047395]|uniref:CGNR zinc finger domain-containing protein n=1 Tax=Dactylosporangium sp. CS-047395 TaxID=3239936 RepID=UPI003D8DA2BA
MYEWRFVGGHLALDLCNTLSWRLDPARAVDRLSSPDLLAAWFTAATGRTVPVDDAALARVRELRAVTVRLFDAHLAGAAAAPGDVRAVHAAWMAALAEAELPGRLPLVPSARGLVPHLVLATVELLQRPDLTDLRRCDGDGCGWLFLDTTRNHSRRWCDAADCGNRARVRAYTRRRRGARG